MAVSDLDQANFSQLVAMNSWRRVEFISDLHLDEPESPTFQLWRDYMASTAADAVFILGDLFEVWIGDDSMDMPGVGRAASSVLASVRPGTSVYFMAGNRDFLVGEVFLRSCGVIRLQDPTCLHFAGSRYLLTHGDQLCVDDRAYQEFRRAVRTPKWIDSFLEKPLSERHSIARSLRHASEERRQRGTVEALADVDDREASSWLSHADANVLIHGHTHRPDDHDLPQGRRRVVLSDWDGSAKPARAEVLGVDKNGLTRQPLP